MPTFTSDDLSAIGQDQLGSPGRPACRPRRSSPSGIPRRSRPVRPRMVPTSLYGPAFTHLGVMRPLFKLGRAHSIGHARQHLNLLGFALHVNSVALHRHREREAPPLAASSLSSRPSLAKRAPERLRRRRGCPAWQSQAATIDSLYPEPSGAGFSSTIRAGPALVGPVQICLVKACGLAAERISRISERPVGAICWPVLAALGRSAEMGPRAR